MPYIAERERLDIDEALEPLLDFIPGNAWLGTGDLNYMVTKIVWAFVKARGINYHNMSQGLAVLRDAEAEMRRRKLDPYEDEKLVENGDVYE